MQFRALFFMLCSIAALVLAILFGDEVFQNNVYGCESDRSLLIALISSLSFFAASYCFASYAYSGKSGASLKQDLLIMCCISASTAIIVAAVLLGNLIVILAIIPSAMTGISLSIIVRNRLAHNVNALGERISL